MWTSDSTASSTREAPKLISNPQPRLGPGIFMPSLGRTSPTGLLTAPWDMALRPHSSASSNAAAATTPGSTSQFSKYAPTGLLLRVIAAACQAEVGDIGAYAGAGSLADYMAGWT
jgi:hypothetical protein